MKPAAFLLFFVFISASVRSQPITAETLQGTWILESWTIQPETIAKEYSPPRPDDNIWIFKGDSLSRFYFPLQIEGKEQFLLDSSSLYIRESYRPLVTLRLDSGKLFARYYNGFEFRFRRTNLTGDSANIVRILSSDGVNSDLLIGKYRMITHFVPDDEAAYDFTPPVKMSRQFTLSDSAQACELFDTFKIFLKVDGQQRSFAVTGLEWEYSYALYRGEYYTYYVPVITFAPDEWWNGDPFEVVFRADEKRIAKRWRKKSTSFH